MELNKFITILQIEKILQDVVDIFLIPHFLSLGLEASGEWRKNVEVRGNEIWGRHYTTQLALGRKGGTFPPIAPLQRWAMVKLGKSPKEALSVAFAISKKIEREGTEIYKAGGTDIIEILKSPRVIKYVNEKAGGYIKIAVEKEYISQIKKGSKKLV